MTVREVSNDLIDYLIKDACGVISLDYLSLYKLESMVGVKLSDSPLSFDNENGSSNG